MSHRPQQLATVVQQFLTEFFTREIEWPRGCLGTITDIEVTNDCKIAFVNVSVLPLNYAGTVLSLLRRNQGRARAYLSKKVSVRQAPELRFSIDNGATKEADIDLAIASLDEKETDDSPIDLK
jgi:ribosome-binding factor A